MTVVNFGELMPELVAALEGDEEDPWDARRVSVDLTFQSKRSHVALQVDGGPIMACAGWVMLDDIEVAGRHFPAVGLGGVIVRQADRGRGFARWVVELAIGRAAALGPEFMLLFCLADRIGLYATSGFAHGYSLGSETFRT
jgi:predicted N-acetyltransferase YhbS